MTRIRGYLATSLDGFIAGTNDEVTWLQESRSSGLPLATADWGDRDADGLEFEDFLAQVGCIVMGRRTYDVVRGFAGEWPYGDLPMLILTSRPLDDPPPTVTAAHDGIEAALAAARVVADGKDVYVDGGATLRATMEADALDHLIVTMLPTALGEGIPLFTGLQSRSQFAVERVAKWGPGFVQLHLTTRKD